MTNIREYHNSLKKPSVLNEFLNYDLEYLCSQLFAMEIKFFKKHNNLLEFLQKCEDYNTYDLYNIFDSYKFNSITKEK